MRIRRLLVAGLLLGWATAASGQGLTTMTVLDSTGATKTYRMMQDASNRLSQTMGICDPTTGANAAANCATVSSGSINVNVTNANANGQTTMSGSAPVAIASNQSAIPVNVQYGGTAAVADPCQTGTKLYVPISQTANTKLTSAGGSKKTYYCSIVTVGADAENLSLVEGTGSTCGTNTAAIIGGTTAAAGLNFAANSGFSHGSGVASIAAGVSNNTDTCLFQSGSGRVSGVAVAVQQ